MGARTKHGLPGIYNSSALVLSDGDGVALATNASGILQNYDAYLHAGEDLTNDVQKSEQRFSYANIKTATTTTVKSGAGFLHALSINLHVATGVITIYDNTAGSGTEIGIITEGAALLTDPPINVILNVSFGTGLTIVTSQAENITISYR